MSRWQVQIAGCQRDDAWVNCRPAKESSPTTESALAGKPDGLYNQRFAAKYLNEFAAYSLIPLTSSSLPAARAARQMMRGLFETHAWERLAAMPSL